MPKTLAADIIDRLLHRGRLLVTDATESYRLTRATFVRADLPRRRPLLARLRLASGRRRQGESMTTPLTTLATSSSMRMIEGS
jgi:hypothetical protein